VAGFAPPIVGISMTFRAEIAERHTPPAGTTSYSYSQQQKEAHSLA